MLKSILQLIRPHQWTKNIFIFLPLFFSGNMGDPGRLLSCSIAFVSFSLIASSIYCINDIIDVEDDQKHPEKSQRPIANGKITPSVAIILALLLFAVGMAMQIIAKLYYEAILATVLYFIINIGYVFKFKQIAIIDVLCIALGFVIRVVIGGYVGGIALSHWIVLMTFVLALFLGFAKRRDDVLHYQKGGIIARKNIVKYNLDFLNSMMMITATITILSYIMYTLDESVTSRLQNQYIYTTAIFVMVGLFRYLQISMVEEKSGNPTKILLNDRFTQVCIAGWFLSFAFIIYF